MGLLNSTGLLSLDLLGFQQVRKFRSTSDSCETTLDSWSTQSTSGLNWFEMFETCRTPVQLSYGPGLLSLLVVWAGSKVLRHIEFMWNYFGVLFNSVNYAVVQTEIIWNYLLVLVNSAWSWFSIKCLEQAYCPGLLSLLVVQTDLKVSKHVEHVQLPYSPG